MQDFDIVEYLNDILRDGQSLLSTQNSTKIP